MYHTVILCSDT